MTHADTDKRSEKDTRYERPEVLASYTEAELAAEAALCAVYNCLDPIACGN